VARTLVITGPSGVGKGTLIRLLLAQFPGMSLSVSATTRAPRPGEEDGVDYHFLTPEEFQRRIDEGEFLEWAEYSGNRYGTLRSELDRDVDVLVLEIEVQGARHVRERVPEATTVFIAPPSAEALRDRLVGRGTDDADQVVRRLDVAEEEMKAQDEFDFVIVNDDLGRAVQELGDLVATMWQL
jgi:guanylate kinase